MSGKTHPDKHAYAHSQEHPLLASLLDSRTEGLRGDQEQETDLTLDERLFLWLLRYPLQRALDLALALNRDRSTLSRHLTRAEAEGLIEAVRPALETPPQAWYHLTTRGIEYAADLVGAIPKKLAQMWQANEAGLLRLLPRLPGLTRLQTLVNGLVQQAPFQLAYPGGHLATIRWHWIRDVRLPYQQGAMTRSCRIDAALVLKRQITLGHKNLQIASEEDQPYRSILLMLDPGWIGPHDQQLLRDRLQALLQARSMIRATTPGANIPPLLVLTESPHARDEWCLSASQVAQMVQEEPLTGAVAAWPSGQPCSSVWSLAWQDLTTKSSCRLLDLFQPLTREMILPGLLAPRSAPSGTFPALAHLHQPSSRTRRSLVIGHLMQRAQDQQAHRTRPASSEREQIALLSLSLPARYLRIIQELYAHPLLSREELAMFVGIRPASLQRALFDLRRQWTCIEEHVTTWGKRLALTRQGLLLVAARLAISPTHICAISKPSSPRQASTPPFTTPAQRGTELILRTIEHRAGLYTSFARLYQAAKQRGHAVAWWEVGLRCARRYQGQDGWCELMPDAWFGYQRGDRIVQAWVEYLTETMSLHTHETSFQNYARYVQSRHWYHESPVLPMLLIIVAHSHQEDQIRRMVAYHMQGISFMIQTTTISRLHQQGWFAPIWFQVWKEARPNAPSMPKERQPWLTQ